ncbi:DNA-binding transcription factor yap1 [Mortierella claussenii]|nr:DNA-binding transcription factor yap1 [Mortierella claussenii]
MSLQQQQQHPDIYPVTLTDNDWAQILHSNREAQDLLSTAIAHHEQYREDDPIKRKGVISSSHQNGARGDNEQQQQQHYSENDHSSDEGHSPGEGKPAPKKAGRKPLTTEPTNKRKAQNRAAQRAFRDRKERYVKSLEERIKELEDLNPGKTDTKLAEENMNLKVLVQKLETENYFLKEQAFTFDFPISQPGLYSVAKMNRDGLLNTNATRNQNLTPEHSSPSPASQAVDSISSATNTPPTPAQNKPFAASNVAKPPSHNQLPWSPPSSVGDSVPNSPLDNDLPTPEQESVSQTSYSDGAGEVPRFRNSSPEEIALFSQILDGTGNTATVNHTGLSNNNAKLPGQRSISQMQQFAQFGPSSTLSMSSVSPVSTLAGFSEHSPSPTLEDLVNTPLFGTHNGNLQFTPTTTNLSVPPMTFEQTQALFTDFRDPSDPHDFFAGFEDPVESAQFSDDKIGELFSDQLLDYTSVFNNLAATTPSATTTVTTATAATTGTTMENEGKDFFDKEGGSLPGGRHGLPPLGEDEKAIPCPQVWDHIAKHPKFDEAEIDDLCAELKSKAKCSGHGPVISLSDVNKLMTRLDQA